MPLPNWIKLFLKLYFSSFSTATKYVNYRSIISIQQPANAILHFFHENEFIYLRFCNVKLNNNNYFYEQKNQNP